MHHQRWNSDLLQVLGEVSLGEGLHPVVVGLRAPHHALAPPILDHALRHLGTRPIEAVEGTAGEIEVELRAVRCVLLTHAIQNFDGHAAWIGSCPDHERWYRTNKHEFSDSPLWLAVTRDVAGRFAATCRVPDMDRVAKVQML